VGGYTPGNVCTWVQFGFWSKKGSGACTYPSRTGNPQSFASSVAGSGHDLEERFTRAERGELVRRDGSGTVPIDEARALERYRRTAQECAPTLLVFGGTLAECQSYGSVLGNLLRKAGLDASKVGEALRREDAHHEGLTGASEQWDDVAALTS
jgi:hypothetical protein